MNERVDVIWRCNELSSAEHFRLHQDGAGWVLAGDVALVVDQMPAHIGYRVSVTSEWVPTDVSIHADLAGATRHLVITCHAGRWSVDGHPRADLNGCTDIDLGWTPATNTIPIRRLARAGDMCEVRAAWVTLPAFEVRPVTQHYTPLGPNRWRYAAGASEYQLEVSEEGVVTQYGDDLWQAECVLRETP